MISSLLVIVFLLPGDAPKDDAKKQTDQDAEKIQGTWKLVRVEPGEGKDPENITITFKEGKLTAGDDPPCKYKLDPSQNPKLIDIDIGPHFKSEEEHYAPGIYLLDGDKMTIAIVTEAKSGKKGMQFQPRPKNFQEKFHGQTWHLQRDVKK